MQRVFVVIWGIILLLFRLAHLYIVRPVCRWGCKSDLRRLDEKLKLCRDKNDELCGQVEDLKIGVDEYYAMKKKWLLVIKEYSYNHIASTAKGEPVIISYKTDNPKDFELHLNNFSENLSNHSYIYTSNLEDSHLCHILSKVNIKIPEHSSMISICDINVSRRRRGYARSLLMFLFEMAKKNNINVVAGLLSSEGEKYFDWLIPFYESLGFEVHLFEDSKSYPVGVAIKYIKD